MIKGIILVLADFKDARLPHGLLVSFVVCPKGEHRALAVPNDKEANQVVEVLVWNTLNVQVQSHAGLWDCWTVEDKYLLVPKSQRLQGVVMFASFPRPSLSPPAGTEGSGKLRNGVNTDFPENLSFGLHSDYRRT
jgi:hypothetical protein